MQSFRRRTRKSHEHSQMEKTGGKFTNFDSFLFNLKTRVEYFSFFSAREVIQAPTKWSKRFKLYKDDSYRKLKRFVWYVVVALFRARAKIEAPWRHNSEFLPREQRRKLWNTHTKLDIFLKIMASNTLHVEWWYLSIERNSNGPFCPNKSYNFTRLL